MATAPNDDTSETGPDHYEIQGHEVIEKEAAAHGTGAHVYLPKEWLGDRVKIVRVTKTGGDEE